MRSAGRARYPDGKPVDVTGEFADGKTLNGATTSSDTSGGKDTMFMRNLSRKMLGYALGRTVCASDQRLVNDMIGRRERCLVRRTWQ